MKFDDPVTARHGRLWISRLKPDMSEGARVRFIQPDYTPPLTRANLTATAAQATLLAIIGATPHVALPEGTGCTRRSEERRVWNECVRTGIYRCARNP